MTDKIEIVNAFGHTRTEEYGKLNPNHQAPTLELDDENKTTLWESNAVMKYLCATAGGTKADGLYPGKDDPLLRAKIDMALDWRQCQYAPSVLALGYIAFGVPIEEGKLKESANKLINEALPVLDGTFLKDTKFVYSDTPTIADLAIGLPIIYLKARKKVWDKVSQKIKDYYVRVTESFPECKQYFDMPVGMIDNIPEKETGWDPSA